MDWKVTPSKVTRSYCLMLNISRYTELLPFLLRTKSLHLAVFHFILLLLVQSINCVSTFSELSKLSFTISSIVESSAYSTIDTSSRLLSFPDRPKQIEEMRSTHTALPCSFTDHQPITHRTAEYQPFLPIKRETLIPVNHVCTQWAYF